MHYEKFHDGTVKCIEDEIPFELPEGWEWTRLGHIGEWAAGATPNRSNVNYYNGNIPWLKTGDLNDNLIYNVPETISQIALEKTSVRLNPVGSVLIAMYGATIGKLGILQIPATTNQACCACLPILINNKFLFYFLMFNKQEFIKHAYGGAQPNISKEKIISTLMPLPPLSEQHFIVDKTEELFEIIDTIESDKSDLYSTIQITKSKILDLAIRGKLVPQDPNDEPASVLLERIRAEKEELIKQGKIKRDKKESVIFKGDDNSYYLKKGNLIESIDDWNFNNIPDNWDICCFGEVCDYGNCINVDTKNISETAWILDLEDIEKDTGKIIQKILKKERKSISTKHLFRNNQVLYSKLRPYLNKVVLADDDGYCTSEILPLDFNDCIYPEYARYYMMSPTFLTYANHCSYGVKMPRLSTTDGKNALFTIPPINEQKRIADKVSQLFSLLDSILEKKAIEVDDSANDSSMTKVYNVLKSHPDHIASMLSGKMPSSADLLRIAEYLNYSVEYFIRDGEFPDNVNAEDTLLGSIPPKDLILNIMGKLSSGEAFNFLQVRISKIILSNLARKNIHKDKLESILLSKRKLDNLFDNSLNEDKVTGFNFSDLVRISEAFNLSYNYMLTGRD